MLHVYEFEVFKGDNFFVAFPYDLDGGTQGLTFNDALEMAADWLQQDMEYRHIHGLDFPEPSFDNEPQHGGKNVIIAVSASKDTVRKVSAAKAAKLLGVTPGRVSQMIAAGLLEAFKDDDGVHTWITIDSVNARLEEKPKAGRPRKIPSIA